MEKEPGSHVFGVSLMTAVVLGLIVAWGFMSKAHASTREMVLSCDVSRDGQGSVAQREVTINDAGEARFSLRASGLNIQVEALSGIDPDDTSQYTATIETSGFLKPRMMSKGLVGTKLPSGEPRALELNVGETRIACVLK
jgi:hypothetical protein